MSEMNNDELDFIIRKRNIINNFKIDEVITKEHLDILNKMKYKKQIMEFIYKNYINYNSDYLNALDLLLIYLKYRDLDINKCMRKPKQTKCL